MSETVSINSVAYLAAHVSLLISIVIVSYGAKKFSDEINRILTRLWELHRGLNTIMNPVGSGSLYTGSNEMETGISNKDGGKDLS